MTTKQKIWLVMLRVFLLLFLSGMIVAAFFLTALLYHLTGFQPPAFLCFIFSLKESISRYQSVLFITLTMTV
jgi:hypothetical protein